MGYAVLFPGQGSQAVGMGKRLFADHDDLLGGVADAVLGWSLREACLEGPLDRLTSTDVAQPALFALSYAAWQDWRRTGAEPPHAAAGHSLGEYTALAAAGALDFEAGLRLVAARGRAMAAAAAQTASGMAAVIGADPQRLEEICVERRGDGGSLWIANHNAPGQIVVAGGLSDINWIASADLGLRRVVPLEVAGAFHTPLMEPAVEPLAAALAEVSFATPTFTVWANADATPYDDDISGTLLRQLTSPVLFAQSLAGIGATGTNAFLHLGPGNVTAGMAKRSVDGAVTAVAEDHTMMSEAAATIGVSVE